MGCQKWAAKERAHAKQVLLAIRVYDLGRRDELPEMKCQGEGKNANQILLAISNHNFSCTWENWKDTEKIGMALVQR